MNKGLIKVVVITVICTLLSVGIVAAITIPRVIDNVKEQTVMNYEDEYDQLAYILKQSKDPVIQENYIITGLIMSPDFQEYLDEGVQNGWWTEQFLEQFLIDEALPIFFTNYHVIGSLILGSEKVQNASEKVTTIRKKLEQIVPTIKLKVGNLKLVAVNSKGKINSLKTLIANVKMQMPQIKRFVTKLQAIDTAKLNASISKLKSVVAKLQAIDSDQVADVIEKLNAVVSALENVDQEALADVIETLKNIANQINSIDQDQLQAVIEQLQAVIDALAKIDPEQVENIIQTLKEIQAILDDADIDAIKEAIAKIKNLIDKIEAGDFTGVIGDILTSILESEPIQNILDKIELTIEGVIKAITFYFEKFKDVIYDYNWYDSDPTITIDGEDYHIAWILNVIEVEIPETGYVYDDNGTKLNTSDDTLTISTIYVGFEVDGDPVNNILSVPVTINGAKALIVKNLIPKVNDMI